jgi:uncharacterized membrane protein YccC
VDQPFRHKFHSDLKLFFAYNRTERLWQSPVLAALAVGSPMLVGYFTDQLRLWGLASFGGLVVLHYTPLHSLAKRMLVLLCCAAGIVLSFFLGTVFSFSFGASVIFIGVYSFVVYYITKTARMRPPGNFFFITVAIIGCSLPHSPHTPTALVLAMAAGTLIACALAFFYGLIFQPRRIFSDQAGILRPSSRSIVAIGLITAAFLCISMIAGHLLGVQKSYWIPMSCLAIMQGITRQHVFQRMFHRIAGTFVGLGLCWAVLKIDTSPLVLIIMVMTFQFVVETFVSRNYGLAIIFVTPMTILMAEIGNPSLANPDSLALIRLADISAGSVIGAVGGWLIHNEQLRASAIRTIRIGRIFIRRRIHQ